MLSIGLIIMSYYINDEKELIKNLQTNINFKNSELSILLMDKSSKRKHLNVQVQL